MHKTGDFQFLKNNQIDKQRWDECVNKAFNSRVYGLSVYLDSMCSNWDALVYQDYKVVMPLPWRKKYGIYYLYQPAFCQQAGIFADVPLMEKSVSAFLSLIPARFKYWEIALNSGNTVTSYNTRPGKNYLLPLDKSYEDLFKNYNRNTKRNIKKAVDSGIKICENISIETAVSLHRRRFRDSVGATKKDYERFLLLLNHLSKQEKVYSIGAIDKNNVIIASSIYLLHNNRIIFILNGNLQTGLDSGSAFLLKDFVINKFSGKELIMDFEGSDNVMFARFYQQFGAKDIEYYPCLVNNKLPWPFKYLKSNAAFVK